MNKKQKSQHTSKAPTVSLYQGTVFILAVLLTVLAGCQSNDILILTTDGSEEEADKLFIVDCLLPGQIKKLGAGTTFVTPRRPAKLTAVDCEERGGEYVAYERANSATALKVWLATAQEGNPEAQTYVGEIYEKGFGIRPDYKLAALWYQKAAQQGNARAKLNLGYLYEKGLGVEKNVSLALNLYRQASGLEDTDIDFESVLDSETAQSSVNEVRELKDQLAKEGRIQERQGKDLEADRQQLAKEQETIKNEAQMIAAQRQELEKQQQLASLDEKTLQQREQTLAEKSVALQNKERELKKKQQRLSLPAAQSVAKVEAPIPAPITIATNRIDIAGPSIQLIRPKLVTTRGVPSINVRPENKTREIVGRVNAPAGLQNFAINGSSENIDPRGLFRVLFPINQKRNQIVITAVDRYGKTATLEFELIQSAEPSAPAVAPPIVDASEVEGSFGRFHALVIGNNKYTQFPQLGTAINDAKSVAEVLSSKYGFQTTTLINANRFMILATLNRLSKRLTDKDNLLIYYAGHGELDSKGDVWYWLPVDADRNSKRKWIANTAISDVLGAMPAKRILVIADSCYSGSLTRSSLAQQKPDVAPAERLTWLRAMAKSRARLAMTSGGLEPVADDGGSNHSVFANALIEALDTNQGILEGTRLYNQLSGEVVLNAKALNIDQTPEYAPIHHAGHESGEFFFLRRES